MNKVTLIGNLTATPELMTSKEGEKHYTRFTIAVNPRRGKDTQTDFLEVVAFGKKAEVITAHTLKGTKLMVSGRLSKSNYTTELGEKRSSHKVILEDFEFVGGKVMAKAE